MNDVSIGGQNETNRFIAEAPVVQRTQVAAGVDGEENPGEEADPYYAELDDAEGYGEEIDEEELANLEEEMDEALQDLEDYLDSPENYLLQEGNKMIEKLGDAEVFVDEEFTKEKALAGSDYKQITSWERIKDLNDVNGQPYKDANIQVFVNGTAANDIK